MGLSTLRPPRFDGAAAVMFDAMSAISEAAHDLRWTPGTEYSVWTLLKNPEVTWGRVRPTDADVAPALLTIRTLVMQTHEYVIWPPGLHGPIAVTLTDWLARYRAETAGRTAA